MFGFLKKFQRIGSTVTLYCFQYDTRNNEKTYNFLSQYFEDTMSIRFKYGGFYTENYEDNYGKLKGIDSKIRNHDWSEVINLTFDDENPNSGNRNISVNFCVSIPNRTTVFLSDEYGGFDLVDFVSKYYSMFETEYGFTYAVDNNVVPCAYSMGAEARSKGVLALGKLSRRSIENWAEYSSKIKEGYIREIFPENIINQKQLHFKNGSESIAEFIKKKNLGLLTEINTDISLWTLNEAEVDEAREFAYKRNLII